MRLWTMSCERRRMQMALLLLMVSGVIRPASLDPPFVGAERSPGSAKQTIDGAR